MAVTAKKGKGKGKKQQQKGAADPPPPLPDSPSQEAASDPPSLPDAHDEEGLPRENPGGGAPSGSRGRGGAPAGVFLERSEAEQVVRKRPAAAPKAVAAKGKAARYGKLPFPEGALEALQEQKRLGHSKCRESPHGCAECRKIGLKLNDAKTAWEWV